MSHFDSSETLSAAPPSHRPTWSGLLQLSLVGIPVKAYPAVRTTEAGHFHLLHADCGQRIRYAKQCPQGLRGLSAPVRLLLHPLPDAAGRWPKGPRQGSAALRRLPRVLQDLFDPVRPAEPPRPPHAGVLRDVLRRVRRGLREVPG